MTDEPSQRGRILVADDVVENVRVLHGILGGDHEVTFALDGAKAVATAHEQLPDLILLDAMMPEMDGFQACEALRADPATADIPIIFVTALDAPEDETRALETGAVDFITKPLVPAVVRARVRTHLTLKRQADMLRRLAMTDGLTGVANRRGFDEFFRREWRRCQRAGQPLALLMGDVDHFKRFNDRFGHPAGDACLKAVAERMSQCARRPADYAARYGGEEFALIMPDTDAQGALRVAERVLEEVRAIGLDLGEMGTVSVTISLGLAWCVPADSDSQQSLIAAADRALYQAKSSGRNRVVVAD